MVCGQSCCFRVRMRFKALTPGAKNKAVMFPYLPFILILVLQVT